MNKKSVSISLWCIATLSGCASINSSYLGATRDDGGLVYFMPKKDLIMEIGVAETDAAMRAYLAQKASLENERMELINQRLPWPDPTLRNKITNRIKAIDSALAALTNPNNSVLKPNSINISVSDSYPDTNLPFSLHSAFNPTGKNTFDVSISNKGLLSGATSKTESQFSEVFVNLASAAGTISGRGITTFSLGIPVAPPVAPPPEVCPRQGSNRLVYDFSTFSFASNPHQIDITCAGTQLTISVEKLWLAGLRNGPFKPCSADPKKLCTLKDKTATKVDKSGLFFRQPMPIQIRVTQSGTAALLTEKIIYSPSLSPLHMLPIRKTLFANNETSFTFTDGVPTKYQQESGGELVSLLKLPADVIAAYFSALGQTFASIGKTKTAETTALQDSLKLQLAREKYKACIDAIATADEEAIEALKCSE